MLSTRSTIRLTSIIFIAHHAALLELRLLQNLPVIHHCNVPQFSLYCMTMQCSDDGQRHNTKQRKTRCCFAFMELIWCLNMLHRNFYSNADKPIINGKYCKPKGVIDVSIYSSSLVKKGSNHLFAFMCVHIGLYVVMLLSSPGCTYCWTKKNTSNIFYKDYLTNTFYTRGSKNTPYLTPQPNKPKFMIALNLTCELMFSKVWKNHISFPITS